MNQRLKVTCLHRPAAVGNGNGPKWILMSIVGMNTHDAPSTKRISVGFGSRVYWVPSFFFGAGMTST